MTTRTFLAPFTLKSGVTLKNRIVMAPMTTCSSFHDGQPTDDELAYYRLRSGGPGMVISAAANVSAIGKGFEGQMSVASDRFIPRLTKVANALKVGGAKAILQLHHSGRMSNSALLRGAEPVSASAIPAERPRAEIPRELTEDEIEATINDFAKAAKRALKAGFDGVEIHGANTYLVQQFFSPHSNRRKDRWGGSLEKRLTFPLLVVERIAQVVQQYGSPNFIVGYRLSPEEYETPGITLTDTLTLIEHLIEMPIDYLHLSLANVWQSPKTAHPDQRPIAIQINEALNERIPLIVVGNISTPDEAEEVIAHNIPLVALGKALLREPKWVEKVEAGDEGAIRYTISQSDYDSLHIPAAMGYLLEKGFATEMGYSHLLSSN